MNFYKLSNYSDSYFIDEEASMDNVNYTALLTSTDIEEYRYYSKKGLIGLTPPMDLINMGFLPLYECVWGTAVRLDLSNMLNKFSIMPDYKVCNIEISMHQFLSKENPTKKMNYLLLRTHSKTEDWIDFNLTKWREKSGGLHKATYNERNKEILTINEFNEAKRQAMHEEDILNRKYGYSSTHGKEIVPKYLVLKKHFDIIKVFSTVLFSENVINYLSQLPEIVNKLSFFKFEEYEIVFS